MTYKHSNDPIKWILITGGAGYIGSAISMQFLLNNHSIIIIDHADLLQPAFSSYLLEKQLLFFKADYADKNLLHILFTTYKIDAVIHCAAFIEVSGSVKHPSLYYTNNVSKSISLFDTMREHAIKKIIFSSSCAVYGVPQYVPINEHHPRNPVSPYGNTKLMVELILQDYAQAYDMSSVVLRYFNAAGSWLEYNLGETHIPESHLIPLALQAAYNQTDFKIFGTNYPTVDGTCVRDYIHIQDLAHAHYQAYTFLDSSFGYNAFNLGTGLGFSVQEILAAIESITKNKVIIKEVGRRDGDPAVLVAQPDKAYKALNWQANYSNLINIISTAHEFYKCSL